MTSDFFKPSKPPLRSLVILNQSKVRRAVKNAREYIGLCWNQIGMSGLDGRRSLRYLITITVRALISKILSQNSIRESHVGL